MNKELTTLYPRFAIVNPLLRTFGSSISSERNDHDWLAKRWGMSETRPKDAVRLYCAFHTFITYEGAMW